MAEKKDLIIKKLRLFYEIINKIYSMTGNRFSYQEHRRLF